MRCVACIDKPFAVAVLSVYKEASRVPCSTDVSRDDAATVCVAIERAAWGSQLKTTTGETREKA